MQAPSRTAGGSTIRSTNLADLSSVRARYLYYIVILTYILVEDLGETDAEPFSKDLSEAPGTKSAVMQLAAKYHGIGIVWEHRYYGQSVPFVQVLFLFLKKYDETRN
jgi:hypothetical protein